MAHLCDERRTFPPWMQSTGIQQSRTMASTALCAVDLHLESEKQEVLYLCAVRSGVLFGKRLLGGTRLFFVWKGRPTPRLSARRV